MDVAILVYRAIFSKLFLFKEKISLSWWPVCGFIIQVLKLYNSLCLLICLEQIDAFFLLLLSIISDLKFRMYIDFISLKLKVRGVLRTLCVCKGRRGGGHFKILCYRSFLQILTLCQASYKKGTNIKFKIVILMNFNLNNLILNNNYRIYYLLLL